MIIRRVIARLRDQEWTAVVIDFVIVVLGVFLGIQASNLNSARSERALEKEYLERIVTDLGSVIEAADFQKQFEHNKSQQVIAALATTWQPPSDRKRLRLGTLLSLMAFRVSPNFESPTFSDLQNSGHLSLISDAPMRAQLSSYFARLQYLRNVIGRNNDNYVEKYVDFLRRDGIGAGFADQTALGEVALTKTDADIVAVTRARFGTLDIKAHSSSLSRLPSDPFWEELRANLAWRGFGAAVNEDLVNRIITDAEKMKNEVEKQRGDRD